VTRPTPTASATPTHTTGTVVVAFFAARAAGVPTLNYGVFLNTVINFLIVSFAMFVVIRQVNRLYSKPASAGPGTKECLYCATTIPTRARRCPHCTSDLASAR